MTDADLQPLDREELVDELEQIIADSIDIDWQPRWAAEAIAERFPDLSTAQPRLARHQPCGCIICTCESDERCSGCGAKCCGNHAVGEIPNPVFEGDGVAPVTPAQAAGVLFNDAERGSDPSWIFEAAQAMVAKSGEGLGPIPQLCAALKAIKEGE